jgi:aryl-alcohol dehydrogenase-like predicted oxidoreductase
MEYRSLGRTGLKVSAICLGTMTWGEQNTETEGHEQMDYALDHGINFFDTAELYPVPPKAETVGRTENIIGSWFHQRKNRDKVILATKVVGRTPMNWFRQHKGPTELNRTEMTEALEGSLRRLRTDHIDLYQLHWPDRPMPWGSNPTHFKKDEMDGAYNSFQSILEVLQDFVKQGKVRHIGLSNESAWGTMRFLAESDAHGLPRVASIQNAYSLINRLYEVALAEIGLREDVGLLAYSPLGQGYLTGKYRHGALPEKSRKALFNRLQRYEKPGTDVAIEAYWDLAQELRVDLTQLALSFVTSRCFVTSNIIGATTMEQLKTCIGSTKLVMTPEIEARIDAIHQVHMNPAP